MFFIILMSITYVFATLPFNQYYSEYEMLTLKSSSRHCSIIYPQLYIISHIVTLNKILIFSAPEFWQEVEEYWCLESQLQKCHFLIKRLQDFQVSWFPLKTTAQILKLWCIFLTHIYCKTTWEWTKLTHGNPMLAHTTQIKAVGIIKQGRLLFSIIY